MPDRFLCDDASCWIDPDHIVTGRKHRGLEQPVEPVLLYTPLNGFGDGDWLADALQPLSRQPIGDVNVRAPATTVELPSGRLTTVIGNVGAPATVGALECCIALGARRILFFGICGSLQPDLRIGDLLAVDEGIREEGTSYHYLRADVPVRATRHLLDGLDVRRGTI
jgi:hypothetical protein